MKESKPIPKLGTRADIVQASGTSRARMAGKKKAQEGTRIIDFTIGELALETSPLVKQCAIQAIARGENRYTDTLGLPQLRAAIAAEFTDHTGLKWNENEVALTAGAKAALYYLSLILLDRDDEAIIPSPYWQTFPQQVRIAGGTAVVVANLPDRQLDIPAISAAITSKTKVIVVNTPGNPTGAVYSDQSLLAVAQLAIRNNLWIIFDQCYRKFVYAGIQHRSIVSIAPEVRDRTIIIDSFSKTLAVAGWRLGYVVAPTTVIDHIRAFQSHITSCPNVIAQYGVLGHIQSDDNSFVDGLLSYISSNRRTGLDLLSGLRRIAKPPAQGGFYFYLDVSPLLGLRYGDTTISSVDDVATLLVDEAGAATVPGTAFGDPHGIRLSFAVRREDLVTGLAAVVETLNRIDGD